MSRLLFFNFVVFLLSSGLLACWAVVADASVRFRYVELDRAGVVNHEALVAYDATLANNDRNRVPRWLVEPMRRAQLYSAAIAAGIAFVNGTVLLVLVLRNRRKSQGCGPVVGS